MTATSPGSARVSAALWRRWIVPNASLTEVEWDPGRGQGRLLRHGDAEHLGELTAEENGA